MGGFEKRTLAKAIYSDRLEEETAAECFLAFGSIRLPLDSVVSFELSL
jgi:hypothetical protein